MEYVIDPERAIIAAVIMVIVGIAIFVIRNRSMFGRRLRSRYE